MFSWPNLSTFSFPCNLSWKKFSFGLLDLGLFWTKNYKDERQHLRLNAEQCLDICFYLVIVVSSYSFYLKWILNFSFFLLCFLGYTSGHWYLILAFILAKKSVQTHWVCGLLCFLCSSYGIYLLWLWICLAIHLWHIFFLYFFSDFHFATKASIFISYILFFL